MLVVSEFYIDQDVSPTLYIGVPLSALVGVVAADSRAARVLATPTALLASPYEVELKARQLLHAAVWGHPTNKGSGGAAGGGPGAGAGKGPGGHGGAARPAAASLAAAQLVRLDDSEHAVSARVECRRPPTGLASAHARACARAAPPASSSFPAAPHPAPHHHAPHCASAHTLPPSLAPLSSLLRRRTTRSGASWSRGA